MSSSSSPVPFDSLGIYDPTPFREAVPLPPQPANTKLLEKPKRPLTAYNMFFQNERQVLLDTLPVTKKSKRGHGKIAFADLAKVIGKRWKEADPDTLAHYYERANQDKLRYHQAMSEYRYQMRTLEQQQQTYCPPPVEPLEANIPDLAEQLGVEMTDFVIRNLR